MNSRPCWPSAAAGLRSALSRNEPKTIADADGGGADADRREAGADHLVQHARSMIISFVKSVEKLSED